MFDAAVSAQLSSYLPPDRLRSVLSGVPLPERSRGSTLFADISGFTPLTEAVVTRYGARRGGEELTDRLNKVYDALITEVDRHGGSVIGFAGDAITCWFAGDDGLLAASCALSMREKMDAIREITLPDGSTFSLGMKVAVAAGSVRRHSVGSPEIGLFDVVSGRVLERLADAEHEAERGDVVLDQGVADELESRLLISRWKERESDGRRYALIDGVRESPETRGWPPLDVAASDWEKLRPWLIPQIYRRLAAGEGNFLTELRPAAAVFVRFSGIDFEEDSDAAAKLDTYFRWVQGIIERLKGIVVQLTIGDKGSFLYAAFGAPIAHDNDTRRALTAALEIAKPPAELAAIAGAVQVGVTRGTMRTGAYGGKTRRTYGVLGDDVNLSARLMGKAGPGEVFVSEAAARRHRESFEWEPLPPMKVKGKTEPVNVFRLIGRSRTGISRLVLGPQKSAPMIGRLKEKALAADRLAKVVRDRGQVISISGDAGMGKTRLLVEVVSEAARLDLTGFAGDCPVLAQEASYSVWMPIWRSFFGIKPDASPIDALGILEATISNLGAGVVERAPLLGPVLNLTFPDNELTRTLDPKTRRSSMDGLLIECVRQRSQREPLLFVLEEAHWIDGASRHLLRALVQAIARIPVAIILANRPVKPGEILGPEEMAADYITEIELGDLPPDDCRSLVDLKLREVYGLEAVLPPKLTELIATRASGNPFFIEEVTRLLKSRQVDWSDSTALDSLELPASLHSLVLGRIDQLTEDSQTTLKVASVIGRMFRSAVLWGVHPVDRGRLRIPDHLAEMQERDVVLPEPVDGEEAYLFKHIVIQEVAYESLPYALKATIHEAVGRYIEKMAGENPGQWLDLLAFHFDRSNCDDEKRFYLLAAGDAAMASYSISSAISYYQRALRLLAGEPRIDALLKFGEVLELAGRWDEAFVNFRESREAAEQWGTAGQQASAAARIGDFHRKRGDFPNAAIWLERAREENAIHGDELGVAHVLHLLGTLSAQSGDFEKAVDLFGQALEIRERLGDDANAAKTLNNLGIVARSRGDVETALVHYERSLAIRRRINDRREIANSLNNLGFAHRFRKQFDRAHEMLEESIKLNRAVGDRWSTANALTSMAELALDIGDAEMAGPSLRESIKINRELGDRRAQAYALEGFGHLGRLLREGRSALMFFAAAGNLRQNVGAPLEPADAEKLDKVLNTLRAEVGDVEAAAAEEEGRNMPLGQILDRAAAAFV